MSEFYSIEIPTNVSNIINEASLYVTNKSKTDVNNKFIGEKYKLHMTFIYFGSIIKEPSVIKHIPEIEKLIYDTIFDVYFDFESIDLFGRFIVLKYKLRDKQLIEIKEKLLSDILNIISDVDEDIKKTFISKNYRTSWDPHITIGSIRTPGIEYCNRKKISIKECIEGSYKTTRDYLSPFLKDAPLSFKSTKIVSTL